MRRAASRLEARIDWARAKWKRWLLPLARAVNSVEKRLQGILGHWEGELSTAFMQGLDSILSAIKRKAHGYRNTDYLKTML